MEGTYSDRRGVGSIVNVTCYLLCSRTDREVMKSTKPHIKKHLKIATYKQCRVKKVFCSKK
jgi:hypothetical protein